MLSESELKEIRGFLDGEGRLTGAPAKRKKKLLTLLYLAERFEPGKAYTEKEINAILNGWHTFGDPATLRRELVDHHLLTRDAYGTEYRKAEQPFTVDDLLSLY